MTAGYIFAPSVIPLREPLPGKLKSCIDTNTFLELHSDSPQTDIFYSIDGTVPNPRDRKTNKYTCPFKLKNGKHIIKAQAVTKDGCLESAVVTKSFLVEFVPSPVREYANVSSQETSIIKSDVVGNAWMPEQTNNSYIHTNIKRKSYEQPYNKQEKQNHEEISSFTLLDQDFSAINLSSTNKKRTYSKCEENVTLGDNFQICFKCLSKQRIGSANKLCMICGHPFPDFPSMSSSQQIKTCPSCSSINPSYASYCMICEERLQPNIFSHHSVPSSPTKRYIPANHIRNISSEQACVISDMKLVKCLLCNACSQADVCYCHNCGFSLSATSIPIKRTSINKGFSPPKTRFSSAISTDVNSIMEQDELTDEDIIFTNLLPKKAFRTVSTQTIGLFFLSAKEIEQRTTIKKKESSATPQVRSFTATALSPGKGYWRRQLEYILQQLKAYVQDNPDLKKDISDIILGKLVQAKLFEVNEEQLRITLDFSLPKPELQCKLDQPSQVIQSIFKPIPAENNKIKSIEKKPVLKKKAKKRKKPMPTPNVPELQDLDIELLSELSDSGKGTLSCIQDLLNKGANPNCKSIDGTTPLYLAVVNRHMNCIPFLVQAGADVNYKIGIKRNTALHAALSLGPLAITVMKILLSFGADPLCKNKKGETVYELSAKFGYKSIIRLLVKDVGANMITKLSKPRICSDAENL